MCLACSYNLRGLTNKGSCPECGFAIERTIVARQGMTKRELAALAFRVTALWMALGVITEFLPIWSLFFSSLIQTVSIILGAGVSVLLVAVVWWKAELLAKLAIKTDGPISLSGRLVTRQIMSVALGIIGVLYVIYGMTGVAWILVSVLIGMGDEYRSTSITDAVLNLTIGLVLLFGVTRIAKSVIWLRTVGTRRQK